MDGSVVQSITQIDFSPSPKKSALLGIRHAETGVHLMRDYNVVIIIFLFCVCWGGGVAS